MDMDNRAEQLLQMLDEPSPERAGRLRARAASVLMIAALPSMPSFVENRPDRTYPAFDHGGARQVLSTPTVSMRIDRPKKNVNRPPGAKKRKAREARQRWEASLRSAN